MLSESEAQQLLDDLCVVCGFCLRPEESRRLMDSHPADVLSFTDAVFRAEGMDPDTADRHLYRGVRDMVANAFRGAS